MGANSVTPFSRKFPCPRPSEVHLGIIFRDRLVTLDCMLIDQLKGRELAAELLFFLRLSSATVMVRITHPHENPLARFCIAYEALRASELLLSLICLSRRKAGRRGASNGR